MFVVWLPTELVPTFYLIFYLYPKKKKTDVKNCVFFVSVALSCVPIVYIFPVFLFLLFFLYIKKKNVLH